MNQAGNITMTMREVGRLKTIQAVMAGKLTTQVTAEIARSGWR